MAGITQQSLGNILVGRERELSLLRKTWQQARQGSGSLVLITGEEGIGKKALVRRFVEGALRDEGAILGSANFAQSNSCEPYAPFLKIVTKLQHSVSHDTSNLQTVCVPGPANASFQQSGNWDLQSLYSLQAERQLVQQRLLSSVLQASQEKPLLIELSDMQSASITAWRFLHYLCESVSEHSLLIIASLQQADTGTSTPKDLPYSDVLQRMNREGLLNKIDVGRLDPADARDALRVAFPKSDFSGGFVPMLVEIADGIPAHLVKLVTLAVGKNFVYQQDEIWFNRDGVERELLLKLLREPNEKQPTRKILSKLTATARSILEYAAITPKPIDGALLVSVVDGRRIQIIKNLARLVENQLLRQIGEDKFWFGPFLTPSALIEKIAPDRLLSMHREIAAAIETSERIAGPDRTYRLAHHWSRTNEHGQAFRYLSEAAKVAITNFAFLEARHFIQQAVCILDIKPDAAHKEDAVRLLTQAAWLTRILGYWGESKEYCSRARRLMDDNVDDCYMNQVLIQEGLTHFRRNDWGQARAAFEHCLSSRICLSLFDQAMILNGLGSLHFEMSDYKKANKCFEEALDLANTANATRLKANIINSLGAVKNVRGNHVQALALYSQCIPLFDGLGDLPGMAKVYHNIGMTYADECNWDEANKFYGKSLKVSDEMGLAPLKSTTFLNRAMALLHLKKFDEAREYNFKAHRLLQRLGDNLGMAEYHKIQGVIERHESRWQEAAGHLQEASKQFESLRNQLGSAETAYELGQLSIEIGEHDTAVTWLKQAIQSYSELGLEDKVKMINTILQNYHQDKRPVAPFTEANQ